MLLCFWRDCWSPLGQKKLSLQSRVCQISATPWQQQQILVQDRWYLLKYVLTFSCQEILPHSYSDGRKTLPLLNAFQGSHSLLCLWNSWLNWILTYLLSFFPSYLPLSPQPSSVVNRAVLCWMSIVLFVWLKPHGFSLSPFLFCFFSRWSVHPPARCVLTFGTSHCSCGLVMVLLLRHPLFSAGRYDKLT